MKAKHAVIIIGHQSVGTATERILREVGEVVVIDTGLPIHANKPFVIHAKEQIDLPSLKVMIKEELKVTQQWNRKNQYSNKKKRK